MPDAEVPFLDTNIVLYALSQDESKRQRAIELLVDGPVISAQVLSEASNVLARKYGLAPTEVVERISEILRYVAIVRPVDEATVRTGWEVWQRYRFAWYDSLIIAAALAAGCNILYTEDMQHGQVINGKLTLLNPFVPDND